MVDKVLAEGLGVPSYQRDDGYADIELLIGDVPANGAPIDIPVPANSTFRMFSVVGISGGVMALAKADGSVKAVGVLMLPVAQGADTDQSARCHTSGHFNGNRLVWDPSFDTNAKKVAAFEQGKSNILIGFNPYDPVKA